MTEKGAGRTTHTSGSGGGGGAGGGAGAENPDASKADQPARAKEQLIAWGRTALPSIVGAIGFTGFVSILGAAVVWMRFSTAGIPADQAVHDLPLTELVVPGAVSLILYLVLGLAAVLVVYLLQGVVMSRMIDQPTTGDPVGHLKRTAELSEARVAELRAKIAALEAGSAADKELEKARLKKLRTEALEAAQRADRVRRQMFRSEAAAVAPVRANQWGLMVLVAAEIIIVLLRTSLPRDSKIWFGIGAVVVLGMVLLAATRLEPAKKRPDWTDRRLRGLVTALLLIGAVVLVAEENWTLPPVLAALALALANLGVGRLYPKQFFWYGISIFVSVGLFGAAVTYSRDRNAPSAQPAAVLLKNGCVIRGLWIGESSKRVFLARLGSPIGEPEGNGPLPGSLGHKAEKAAAKQRSVTGGSTGASATTSSNRKASTGSGTTTSSKHTGSTGFTKPAAKTKFQPDLSVEAKIAAVSPSPFGAGRLFWVERQQVVSESIGKLQRVEFAVNKSGRMRAELLSIARSNKLTKEECPATAAKSTTKSPAKSKTKRAVKKKTGSGSGTKTTARKNP
jgi:hypothetical protein